MHVKPMSQEAKYTDQVIDLLNKFRRRRFIEFKLLNFQRIIDNKSWMLLVIEATKHKVTTSM